MTNDIFTSDFQFPECVSILAPGPVPDGTWDRMTGYVVAVNKGIDIPTRMINLWVVADWWAIHGEWFHMNAIKFLMDVHPRFRTTYCFSEGLWKMSGLPIPEHDLSFRFNPKIQDKPYHPEPGQFRPDGTVSGIAIEMAARLGAKRIELVGMPFRNRDWTYFDGTRSPMYGGNIRKGSEDFWKERTNTKQYSDRWVYTDYMDSLITWVEQQGIEIYSLNETALRVEVRL